MKMKNMFSPVLNLFSPSPSSGRREQWIQAPEAKNQLKLILKQLESERPATEAIIKNLKSIIKKQEACSGEGESASSLALAGLLYKHMARKCALTSIKLYCACILRNLPRLAWESSFSALPAIAQEAIASIVFASRRCDSSSGMAGPMRSLRELLRLRYAPQGGEAERAMERKVSKRIRNECFCEEEELRDEVKVGLMKIVVAKGDSGLKFQLGKENDDEQNPNALSWFNGAFESYEEEVHYDSSSPRSSEDYIHHDTTYEKEQDLRRSVIYDEYDSDDEEQKILKFQGLVSDQSWERRF